VISERQGRQRKLRDATLRHPLDAQRCEQRHTWHRCGPLRTRGRTAAPCRAWAAHQIPNDQTWWHHPATIRVRHGRVCQCVCQELQHATRIQQTANSRQQTAAPSTHSTRSSTQQHTQHAQRDRPAARRSSTPAAWRAAGSPFAARWGPGSRPRGRGSAGLRCGGGPVAGWSLGLMLQLHC